MTNYVYVIKKKFLKDEELVKNGFIRYINEEQEGEIIYAIPVKVNPDSVLVRGLIADLNNKDWQLAANITDEKQKEELAKEGLVWEKQEDGSYKVIETPEMIDEFSSAFLCVPVTNCNGLPRGVLCLKGVDGIMRAATRTLETACKEAINDLNAKGLLYKRRLYKRRKVLNDCRA